MAQVVNVGDSVSQLKDSLDSLQSSIHSDQYSSDALLRLNRALRDIDEEVNMLRNVMQINDRHS